MARHNKPPPDIGFWSERDLRQARDWKAAGFSIPEIANALGRDVTHVQIKWDMDAFSLEIRPKVKKNCLSCFQAFDSEGAHNRICEKCRLKQSTSASVIGEYGT